MRIIALALMSVAVLAAPMPVPVPAGQAESLRQTVRTGPPFPGLVAAKPAAGPVGERRAEEKGGEQGSRHLVAVTHGMQARPHNQRVLVASNSGPSWQTPTQPTNVVVDVLVAYTKRAARNYSDIRRELIEPALEGANESFLLSGLDHIRLRLVHSYQTDYLEEGMHFDHVWRFADKGDGAMDEVHSLRDTYRADIAVLVVDDAKGCGLATRVGAEADDAFAVVHHACAAANYTFAHEVGHLLGASHERAYVHGTKWRDIMSSAASCGGCPRVPLWSSPKVLVKGEPAGSEELDNARVIAEEARRVAAFR
jgi:hypothetical protein